MSKGKQTAKRAYKEMTGKELARLVLEHYVEKDHKRPGLLSEADIASIHNALTGRRMEILEFNAWLETYRLVYMTQLDGKIMSLEATNALLMVIPYLEKFSLADELKRKSYTVPAILTARQLQDLKAKQQAELKADITALSDVIGRRIYQVAMETLSQEQQEDLKQELDEQEEDLIESLHSDWLWVKERLPAVWETAISTLQEIAQSGQLQAVRLSEQAVEEIETARAAFRAASPSDLEKPYEKLSETERRLFEQSRASHSEQDQQAFIQALEAVQAVSEETEDELWDSLEPFKFLAEALYELGLPEWLEWIEEFKPDMEGLGLSDQVAIIPDDTLSPQDLDEHGHYKHSRPLLEAVDLLGLDRKDKRQKEAGAGGLVPMCLTAVDIATDKITSMLSMLAVLETLSELIGVDLTEDFDELVSGRLQPIVDWYNVYVDMLLASPESRQEDLKLRGIEGSRFTMPSLLPDQEDLPRLDLEKLKPSEEWLSYYTERMAINLGPEWFKHVKDEGDLFRVALDTMTEATEATGKPPSSLEKDWQEAEDEQKA